MKLFAAACLVLGWLVPLHLLPWVSWHSELPVFFGVLVTAAYSLFRQLPSTKPSPFVLTGPPIAALIVCLVVVVQASTGVIMFWGDALVLLLYLALAIAAYYLGYIGAVSNQEKLPTLMVVAGTLLAGALVSALLALSQVLGVWEESEWIVRTPWLRRPGGNIGQPNQLATLLIMGLASAFYFYERRKLSSVTAALVVGALLLGIAITESRTALMSLLVLVLWLSNVREKTELKTKLWTMWSTLAVQLSLFVSWPAIISFIHYSDKPASLNTEPGGRLIVWQQLIEAVGERPWFGWGIREVSEAHQFVVHRHLNSEPFTYAHNILLDFAVGAGVPLALVLIAASLVWLHRRLSAVADSNSCFCVAALVPFAVHAMLEFPHAYAYFVAPAFILIGVLDFHTGVKGQLQVSKRAVAIATAFVVAIAGWSVVEYVVIEEDFRVARFESLKVGQTPEEYRRPEVVLLTQLGALLEVARVEPRPAMPAEQIELVRKAALRFPWPATQSRYALSLALNGQQEAALTQLRALRAMHGSKVHEEITSSWQQLASTKYPSLLTIPLR